ncbi:MAG: alpha/beta fold hydrolase [Arthrobacter sp.]|uniref:alpha/beta fold hydrolase n=1 Tax=unclassified Arthrobacter TaxID=235627 RepID=UPI0026500A6A|nr:alpha/beta fold hydrolase [Micrococcaceae bacterium]MDN5813812.1 alpha/beta fold hydrolase [Micrococcaceae bacterium]MDN5824800.1 alpha/beta fold hydrolase [Micrococcaceae bacterium]MDN5878617.1 alpha/beta fold hydrolase [Micrococcaceae bacterium]MDN5886178.1 alpha/beta fold hydrolase [Micrococcaceae bacterium]
MAETQNPRDGSTISYDISGQGPAIVLLHGSALSRAIWRGLGYVKGLEGFTVVRIDLRGHGRSSKPHRPQDYAMDLLVGDVVAVLDAEQLASAVIMGYSFGARVAFSLAAAAPGRVEKLVSLGGTFKAQGGQIAEVFFEGYLQALRTGGMQAFVDGQQLDPQTRFAFMNNDARALHAYFERTEIEAGIEESVVASLELPALLFAGTRDRRRYLDSRAAAELMPAARFVPLEGRTHGSTLAAVDEVLAQLLPFLQGEATY